jgi:hypothetical protein
MKNSTCKDERNSPLWREIKLIWRIFLCRFTWSAYRVQIQKEVISDLKRENQFLSKNICEPI